MIEVLTIVALLVFIGVKEYLFVKERKTLLNAVLAKNTQELKDLELIDKTKINLKPAKPKKSDLVPLEELSDEEFYKVTTGKK